MDAFTSGFEGPWSSTPTAWTNHYFKHLLHFDWAPAEGPGGHTQWAVAGGGGPTAPAADGNGTQAVMMMTSDVSLLADPKFKALVELYANDVARFEADFAAAW